MKKETKKIIIIAAVAVALAVVFWLVFRKAPKGTAEGYIDRLDTSRANRRAIKSHLQEAELRQDIDALAGTNGLNRQQTIALAAAYYLVNDGTVDDATWQGWKIQIRDMQ